MGIRTFCLSRPVRINESFPAYGELSAFRESVRRISQQVASPGWFRSPLPLGYATIIRDLHGMSRSLQRSLQDWRLTNPSADSPEAITSATRALLELLLDALELQRFILVCARTRVGRRDRRCWHREVSARRDLRLLTRRTDHFWSVFSRSLRRRCTYGRPETTSANLESTKLDLQTERARNLCGWLAALQREETKPRLMPRLYFPEEAPILAEELGIVESGVHGLTLGLDNEVQKARSMRRIRNRLVGVLGRIERSLSVKGVEGSGVPAEDGQGFWPFGLALVLVRLEIVLMKR